MRIRAFIVQLTDNSRLSGTESHGQNDQIGIHNISIHPCRFISIRLIRSFVNTYRCQSIQPIRELLIVGELETTITDGFMCSRTPESSLANAPETDRYFSSLPNLGQKSVVFYDP